ncbi:UbiA prenyltransferase family protein [Candidatus Saccharibacteria bacterium]|nr:UbiA prenyltransferase family protein [Candidatus Saccharibacteria bacterium]MBI3337910.1 UbiA prenyltransferase family protein [Candidatus Saccharibacteria bacterium]
MGSSKTIKEAVAAASYFIDLARPYNAPAALLPFFISYFFYDPVVNWQDIIVGFLLIVILHSVFTIQNDILDLEIDKSNHRSTPLTNGLVSSQSLRQTMINLYIVSVFIASFGSNKELNIGFVLLYSALAWAYNSPPIQASRRPILSITLLGFLYSALLLAFGFLLSGRGINVLILVLFMLARMSISILKDFKDAPGDKKNNKRTFYLVYGQTATKTFSLLMAAICYPLIIWLIVSHLELGGLAISALVFIGFVNIYNRLLLLKTDSESQLAKIFRKSFWLENYYETMVLVCLVIY